MAPAALLLQAFGLQLAQGMSHYGSIPAVVRREEPIEPRLVAHFIGKFCFDYQVDHERVGSIQLNAWSDPRSKWHEHDSEEGLTLMMWSDEGARWPAIRKSWPDTCEALHETAARVDRVRIVNHTEDLWKYKFDISINVKQAIRPRWWYFALVACNVTELPEVKYHVHAVNYLRGWEQEFGMDEEGSVALDLITWLLFGFLFVWTLGFAMKRFGHGALRERPLLRGMLAAVALSSFGGVMMLADSLTFAFDGVGNREAAVVGAFCECIAKVQIALLQLFLVRGRGFLQSPSEYTRRCVVQISVALYVAIALGSEVYEQYFGHLDWSVTVYFYSSRPGMVLVTLNVALFVDVMRSTVQLFRRGDLSPELRGFYMRAAGVAALYFLALPLVVLVATVIEPWARTKVVERVEVLSRFLVSCALVYCLWPSRLDHLVNARLDLSMDGAEPKETLMSLSQTASIDVQLAPRGALMRGDEETGAGAAAEES